MTRSWVARLGIGVAAVAIGAVATAPAYALPDSGNISLSPPSELKLGAEGSPGKAFWHSVWGQNTVNPKLVIDLSDVSSLVTGRVDDDELDCAEASNKITCNLPDGDLDGVLPVIFVPKAGSKDGDSGAIKYSVSADNAAGFTTERTLTLADGVDLYMLSGHSDDTPEVKPGDTVKVPVEFANLGNRTAEGLRFKFFFEYGLLPKQYNNCSYAAILEGTWVTCDVTGVSLKPDFQVKAEDFLATVSGEAFRDQRLNYSVEALGESTPLPPALLAKLKKGSGDATFGVGAASERKSSIKASTVKDVDLDDNFGWQFVFVKNTYDMAAVGANATGASGSVVPVEIGLKANGPGSIDAIGSGGEAAARFIFNVPNGTEVMSIPPNCYSFTDDGQWEDAKPGKPKYECKTNEVLRVGRPYLVTFGLKIVSGESNLTGTVDWQKHEGGDANAANDTANVVINGTGGGGGGGPLPVTGTQTALIATGGTAILAAGAVLFVLARRRRVVLVTPDDRDSE